MTGKNKAAKKPFIGMHFKCCNIYTRIYLNKQRTAFVGWCPKCTVKTTVKVAPGGTSDRFFTAN